MGEKNLKNFVDREPRQTTYLVIRILKSKLFTFLSTDAQLIDLSSKGMKLKLPNPISAEIGKCFWVEVPLPHPDGHVTVRMECVVRWYDSKNLYLGIELPSLEDNHRRLLQHYIQVFRKLGRVQV